MHGRARKHVGIFGFQGKRKSDFCLQVCFWALFLCSLQISRNPLLVHAPPFLPVNFRFSFLLFRFRCVPACCRIMMAVICSRPLPPPPDSDTLYYTPFPSHHYSWTAWRDRYPTRTCIVNFRERNCTTAFYVENLHELLLADGDTRPFQLYAHDRRAGFASRRDGTEISGFFGMRNFDRSISFYVRRTCGCGTFLSDEKIASSVDGILVWK